MIFAHSFIFSFLLLFCTIMSVASTRSVQLSNLLFRSLTDTDTKIDLQMAKRLLSQFNSTDSIVGLVNNEIPILHYLLNLHRGFQSVENKTDVIEIMVAALKVGADPAQSYQSDPPLLFKAILLKEYHLAKLICQQPSAVLALLQGNPQFSVFVLKSLYSTPSESVPLAKLLLHADTIVRGKANMSVPDIRKLLSTASLGKPAIKSSDLDIYSSTYTKLLENLGHTNEIKLMDLIASLDELAGSVHESLLNAVLSTILNNKNSDSSGGSDVVVQFVKLLLNSDGADHYTHHRTSLHYLALSGSSVMLTQLNKFLLQLKAISDSNDNGSGSVGNDGITTTTTTTTPTTTATTLYSTCTTLFTTALTTPDNRRHTPVSYAIMRFGSDSPVVVALQLLCTTLQVDFDSLAAHSKENGVLRDATKLPTSTTTTTTHDTTIPTTANKSNGNSNGGWRSKRLPNHEATVASDNRIAEVTVHTLPNNKEFFESYLNSGTPVIFRHATEGADVKGSTAGADVKGSTEGADVKGSVQVTQEVFQKDRFLAQYGDITVPAATIPYAGTFGIKHSLTTLRQVANSADGKDSTTIPQYTFCTPSADWAAKLMSDVPVPGSLLRREGATGDSNVGDIDSVMNSWNFEIQFYLGPAGTGAPVHFHGHAMNTLAYGEKHWLLYPPVHAFYSTTPAQEQFAALHHSTPSTTTTTTTSTTTTANTSMSSPIRVIQRAGDVLYVPALWGHATLNVAQCIGVAHEFSVESFCME